jgi:hypothetical protein
MSNPTSGDRIRWARVAQPDDGAKRRAGRGEEGYECLEIWHMSSGKEEEAESTYLRREHASPGFVVEFGRRRRAPPSGREHLIAERRLS